jgi:hypothetical protein
MAANFPVPDADEEYVCCLEAYLFKWSAGIIFFSFSKVSALFCLS